MTFLGIESSNNTNKLSPQEPLNVTFYSLYSSNNTNKLSPQEHTSLNINFSSCSNNTNKLSPQEHTSNDYNFILVQIIQINLALKNMIMVLNLIIMFK